MKHSVCNSYVEEFAPRLRDYWLTLLPFQDVIQSVSCGPQPQCKHDSMNEPQNITLDFSDWEKGEIVCGRMWVITESSTEGDDGNYNYGVKYVDDDGEYPSTMEELWSFLRSIPRPAHSFVMRTGEVYIMPFNNNKSLINAN